MLLMKGQRRVRGNQHMDEGTAHFGNRRFLELARQLVQCLKAIEKRKLVISH